MKMHWAHAEVEAEEETLRRAAMAKEERRKVDQFRLIEEAEKQKQEELEKLQDKQFVLSVLSKEKAISQKEEDDKQAAKRKTIEFTKALKADMGRRAESEELLIKLQNEEQERQWQKRFETWEKEGLARRALLEDVYETRFAQCEHKNEVRVQQKQNILDERARVDAEIHRLEAIDKERAVSEALLKKRHQEELFRQMDYHQVQRHRELQQHMIEQRQAMIAEERFRQAKEAEKEKQRQVEAQIKEHQREADRRKAEKSRVVAPWEK
jgi:hypothetical protein